MERRLLCESVLVPIDKRISIIKNAKKKGLSYETKASMSFIPMGKMSLWHPIMKRNGVCYVILSLS